MDCCKRKISEVLAARELYSLNCSLLTNQFFHICSCSQKNRSARHARECSQRPFVTPLPDQAGISCTHYGPTFQDPSNNNLTLTSKRRCHISFQQNGDTKLSETFVWLWFFQNWAKVSLNLSGFKVCCGQRCLLTVFKTVRLSIYYYVLRRIPS